MRLSQNGKRSRLSGLLSPDTLTQNRRWKGSTLSVMSPSWNSVNLLASWMIRPGKRAARALNDQRVKDRGESKCRAVTVRIGDNVLHPKGVLTSAWYGMA